MPRWIHSRAKHILAKNPDMDKSQAFAIATQQSHVLGKSPKGYGTEEGKSDAKSKYKDPGAMTGKPNPGNLKTKKLATALVEITKHAFNMNQYSGEMNPPRMQYASSIPPWNEPPVRTLRPKSRGKVASGPMDPMARLNKARKVGAPKAGAPPGPSIAQIAKPKGYGKPMPGAVNLPKL